MAFHLRKSFPPPQNTINKLLHSPQGNLIESYQKTKGLSFSEEKNTIRSRPERNLSVFLEERLLKRVFSCAKISDKSRWGRMKDCRLTIRCFSNEKTKLSVNWILLSKSSQQHLALNWRPCCGTAWVSCSCSWP